MEGDENNVLAILLVTIKLAWICDGGTSKTWFYWTDELGRGYELDIFYYLTNLLTTVARLGQTTCILCNFDTYNHKYCHQTMMV